MTNKITGMAATVAVAVGLSSTAAAQVGSYLGPGVLSRGSGTVGTRGGKQVNMRFGATVTGFYDTGLTPLIVDQSGSLVLPGGTYGVEGSLLGYGTHNWRRAQLGLNYVGNYRHYAQQTYFNGSDQMLQLGYTLQKSQRVAFDFRQLGGTIARGNNGFAGASNVLPGDTFNPNTSLLFDNRATFIQSGMDVSLLASPRTIFTMGGQGFMVHRQSKALIGVNGWGAQGSLQRRVSRETTIGATFSHSHFDFPRAFGESDLNSYQGTLARSLGRFWTFAVQGGVFQVEAQGIQRISFDPAVAAILGTSEGYQTFYTKSLFPSGGAQLTRRFQNAQLAFDYARSFNPGNGVYLTSRTESGNVTLSYTGVRKFGVSGFGGFNSMSGVGQLTGTFRMLTGGASLTYALARPVQLIARYDARQYEFDFSNNFNRVSYRVSIGFSISPSDIPLSLW